MDWSSVTFHREVALSSVQELNEALRRAMRERDMLANLALKDCIEVTVSGPEAPPTGGDVLVWVREWPYAEWARAAAAVRNLCDYLDVLERERIELRLPDGPLIEGTLP